MTGGGDPEDRSRAPYGARGLKYQHGPGTAAPQQSRAPYGARGLKLGEDTSDAALARRAPYGARGLKYAGRDGVMGRVD